MERVRLTLERIASFTCPDGRQQAFLWDSEAIGLAVRVTASGAKSFIFESKLNRKTIRITFGDVRAWALNSVWNGKGADKREIQRGAREEANRLKTIIDMGKDPRQVAADEIAAEQAKRDEHAAAIQSAEQEISRGLITVGDVWPYYIAARAPHWGALHHRDHIKAMQQGGEPTKFAGKLSTPGALASLAKTRLIDLTPELVADWALVEAKQRPTRARLALRLLRAFIFWCAEHPSYKGIMTGNAAQSKNARETLGKPQKKDDVIQREQLAAWFSAVRQIGNPVIAAYLQILLLTGARREELAALKWTDVDFQWKSVRLHDKIEDFRMVPLTPYVASLMAGVPRRNEWVFSSPTAASGYLAEPRVAHNQACQIAGLKMTLHGLRRSFATLAEWVEMPSGIAAQIQGHAPQGVREQNYIRRPLDLLRKWHITIEAWILEQAGIELPGEEAKPGLRVVANAR